MALSDSGIEITWRQPSCSDRSAARELIERVHYRHGRIDGEFIIGFAGIEEVRAIRSEFSPTWTIGDLCLVGAAVVKSGITYAKPKGRRDLAEKRFPGLNIDRLSRDEIVRRMGLALISRVAVEPEL